MGELNTCLVCVCVCVCLYVSVCVCVCSGVGCESWKHVTDSHNIPARKLLASRTPPPCICSSAYVAVDVGSPTLFFEQFCVTCLILGVSWMGTQQTGACYCFEFRGICDDFIDLGEPFSGIDQSLLAVVPPWF